MRNELSASVLNVLQGNLQRNTQDENSIMNCLKLHAGPALSQSCFLLSGHTADSVPSLHIRSTIEKKAGNVDLSLVPPRRSPPVTYLAYYVRNK